MTIEEIIRRVSPYTITNPIRMQALYSTVLKVDELEGDIVETGVFKGGSSMLMAMTLKSIGIKDKKIYMYDTFEGVPIPGEYDIKKGGMSGIEAWHKKDKWNCASIEEVRNNIKKTNYPLDKFILIKGMVEDTIPKNIPEKICLLRLDTDFYKSTKHTLKHLYPRLVKGGYLVIDDYGSWDGCKKAVNEYFKENGLNKKDIKIIDDSCREYKKW